jgi:hypothetical protein
MKALLGIITLPFIAPLLLFAALAEPTFVGEIAWIWWVVGICGGYSLFGWGLQKGR